MVLLIAAGLAIAIGSYVAPPPQSMIETAVAAQLAASPTPESITISTLTPELSNMVSAINTDLSAASPLGWIMVAQYYVIDVTFDAIPKKTDWTAQVHVGCVCMNSTNCCIPERTFVVVVESMRRNFGYVPLMAFDGVGEFRVICSDLKAKEEIGTVSAPWSEVKAYVWDQSPDPTSKYLLRGNAVPVDNP
jgi:hypothetical protein